MMRRRLLLAKRLLKPDGVLIVTIDENELCTLGLLLKDIFPTYEISPISIMHNPRGIQGDNFSYCHETAFFLVPKGLKRIANRQIPEEDREGNTLRKWGNDSKRSSAKNCFYPIFFKDGKFDSYGEVPSKTFHPKKAWRKLRDGRLEFWPLDNSGVERKWRYATDSIESIIDLLTVEERSGELQVILRKEEGKYKTVWVDPSFDASSNGKRLLTKILPDTDFPYPKSIYAVLECLRAATQKKPDALILDFFCGSGTTYHATCLLNAQDGGKRRSISITNNEVTDEIAQELIEKGKFPGDPAYEQLGICQSVAWPRAKHATEGKRRDKSPLPGKYIDGRKLRDGFEENIEYFRLNFLDPNAVARGDAFEAILPILWLMANCHGALETSRGSQPWFIPKHNAFAVLLKESHFSDFRQELLKRKDISHIFLVTDSEDAFRDMAAHLDGYQCMILYKSYLKTFQINTARTNED